MRRPDSAGGAHGWAQGWAGLGRGARLRGTRFGSSSLSARAPALAAADIGMAVDNGTDAAIAEADVIFMSSDIGGVAKAVSLSAAVLRNIKQNLFWAFIYNVLGIPIAAGLLYALGGPLLNPMIGAACMSLSSLCVVSNALRLNLYKPQ